MSKKSKKGKREPNKEEAEKAAEEEEIEEEVNEEEETKAEENKSEKTSKKTKKTRKKKRKKSEKGKIKIKKKHIYAGSGLIVALILILVAAFALEVFDDLRGPDVSGITQGYEVKVGYVGTHEDGEVFDEGNISFSVGGGQVIPGFEEAVIGMEVGQKKTVLIPPEKAYGPYNPEMIDYVELVQVGDRVNDIERFVEIPAAAFPQYFGKNPIEGDVVESSGIEFEVSVKGETVTLETLLDVGETVDNPNAGWKSTVIEVGDEMIKVRHDPLPGHIIQHALGPISVSTTEDKLILEYEPNYGESVQGPYGLSKVLEHNSTHFKVDHNHELAGKTLTFEIEIQEATTPAVFEKPNVKMFVMSFCPFGTQAEEVAYPAQKLFGDKVDFEIHFVIYDPMNYAGAESQYCIEDVCSMHGLPELTEDMRQACIQKYQPEKLWDYLMCVKQTCKIEDIGTCWKTCAVSKGVDVNTISICEQAEGVALMQEDRKLNIKFGVSGSPTILVNDQPYAGQMVSEDMKKGICNYFDKEPGECSEQLDTTAAAAAGSCD